MPDGPHPLLAQLPLTVSPFIQLPKAATLPYTYNRLPSLPPSSVGDKVTSSSGAGGGGSGGGNGGNDNSSSSTTGGAISTHPKLKYVVSASGHAAHPDEVIASCQNLKTHLAQQKQEAEAALEKWQNDIRARDLAEKRRIAPGYLDREEKILQPTRLSISNGGTTAGGQGGAASSSQSIMDQHDDAGPAGKGLVEQQADAGAELDRAFGGMGLK